MTEKEKMIAGLLYDPSDEELEVLLLKGSFVRYIKEKVVLQCWWLLVKNCG